MKTQEFIESGILESHLLGFATNEEQEQVKQMMSADRELADYVLNLESDIRSYFVHESVTPPTAVREIIQLRNLRERKEKHAFKSADQDIKAPYLDIEVNDTHMKVHKFWRPAFIAVFVLSKIFLIAGLYYYFKSASQAEELQKLKAQQVEQLK
ncbi:hypothetical protein [Dyadobacter sp. CY323]|uniref:hypothetical protein n=1 Tax=Dyadobacter sp. CY323 TaxID=2907302 RepID=UPI001F3E231D|nr:hypothetical protein [Dyadobacter sp. CY323]MCE6990446.1 hypothetical protein [Dyadobacter sp. CY323]